MSPAEAVEALPPSPGRRGKGARWRRPLALLMLTLYVVTPAILAASSGPRREAPQLPRAVGGLLAAAGLETVLFCVWFGLAWWLGKPSRRDLQWCGGPSERNLLVGLGAAAAIWMALAAALSVVVTFAAVVLHAGPDTLASLRPRVENVVDLAILRANPVYFGLLLTVVSFGLGGLREELWRAAMFAASTALWPSATKSRTGEWCMVVAVAILFGIGHWAQGPGGMFATGLLGVAFGAVLRRRRSLWEAAFAHGFFDAANFVLLGSGWG